MESAPVDRAGTLALARGSRRLLAKAGVDIVRLTAPSDAEVPVLVLGDLLVRGFTEDLYHEALAWERHV